MPSKDSYLVQRDDGIFATVVAFSPRGAAVLFAAEYQPPRGTQFRLKRRGDGDWIYYTRTKTGVRQLEP